MKNLAQNNKASVYLYDPKTYAGVLLLGTVAEIKDPKIIDTFWHDSWKDYYPEGKNGGDFSMLKFTPTSYKHYTGEFCAGERI